MKIFDNLFGSKRIEGISVDISRHDIYEMKESDGLDENRTQTNLRNELEAADRRVVMLYEKRFINKFKKLGSLNQICPYCAKEFKSSHLGEKKCSTCKKTFMLQKRVQDMGSVVYKLEQKNQFELQWKAVSNIKTFKHYLSHEYEYIQRQLQKQGKKHLRRSEIMHSLINAYAKNSIAVGHYRLYAALMFHKAELMRSEQRFAEALVYYFYVCFLHSNGVDNRAEFKESAEMNKELKERILELLDLGNLQMKMLKDLFDYSIMHLNRFDLTQMSVSRQKSYSILTKEFRAADEAKQEQKPMRSFVLYTKRAS